MVVGSPSDGISTSELIVVPFHFIEFSPLRMVLAKLLITCFANRPISVQTHTVLPYRYNSSLPELHTVLVWDDSLFAYHPRDSGTYRKYDKIGQ